MFNYLPLDSLDEDKLDFQYKAREIADFINKFPSDIPYAISINGAWGTGKSTMLNYVQGYLDNKKVEVIKFNPWMINGKEEMIFSLFEEITYCIKGENSSKIKSNLISYVKKIIPDMIKGITYLSMLESGIDAQKSHLFADCASSGAKSLADSMFSMPLSKIKEQLKELLRFIAIDGKWKVVIIIDEVDRLFPDEIISIFQTIKATLDFPGLFFVVAMDERIIMDAVDRIGIRNSKDYLQKIFQKSYYINSRYQLRTLYNNILKEAIVKKQEESFKDLDYLFDTFVNVKEENFVTNEGEEERKAYGEETLRDLYYSMFKLLQKEFENPRMFIKLCDYLINYWNVFHQESIKKYITNNNKAILLQASFLLLLVHFKYPNYSDFDYINPLGSACSYNDLQKEDKPDLINCINDFLSKLIDNKVIIEESTSDITANGYVFIQKILSIINKFPDSRYW